MAAARLQLVLLQAQAVRIIIDHMVTNCNVYIHLHTIPTEQDLVNLPCLHIFSKDTYNSISGEM